MGDDMHERDLEKALIENLKRFLIELGTGFAFLGQQYILTVAGKDYRPDLIFYHTHSHRHVVIDLKVTEFEPEYIGKLQFYISAIDAQLKTPQDNPTIGLIICKSAKPLVVEYALSNTGRPMAVSEYKIPSAFKRDFPSAKELESVLEISDNILTDVDRRLIDIKKKAFESEEPEKKTAKRVHIVFKTSFAPLFNQLLIEENKISTLFHDTEFVWVAENKKAFKTWEQFSALFKGKNEVGHVRFETWFNGFKKAKTDAFGSNNRLEIIFADYHYEIKVEHLLTIKKMYQQKLESDELNEIIKIMTSKILDEIDRRTTI